VLLSAVNEQLYHFNGVFWELEDKKYSKLHNFVNTKLYNYLYTYISKLISSNAEMLTKIRGMPETLKKNEMKQQAEQNT
jgi:hypothetical protein